ncbi:protein TIC 20-II, chloroplastic-like [Salvia miltiorrhiza]|uniref:protein TIC 20-II, chloroplastic-like n=1 Tax=Salvia miltiorrhiza TaxID=226208 RepID=UPI0025AC03CC|nr:protein TIC 20-II, chloroplastic-like [Salvia miltiorrhiza]
MSNISIEIPNSKNPKNPIMASIALRLSLPNHSAVRLPHPPPQFRPKPTTTRCSYTPTPATERLISAASYLIPFFNGLHYGRFLVAKYPPLAAPFEPLIRLLSRYHSVPCASFVAFLIYPCVFRNPSFSLYARSNALQALVLDLLLVLLQRITAPGWTGTGIGFNLTAWLYSGLLLFVVAGFVSSVVGNNPYLYSPIVAQPAGRRPPARIISLFCLSFFFFILFPTPKAL